MTNLSVNPARSIGPAIFVGDWALANLWLFIVAPLIGAALASVAHTFLYTGAAPVEPEQSAVAAEGAEDASARSAARRAARGGRAES